MTDQASERRQVDVRSDNALQLQEISTSLIREGNLDALYGRILDAAISLLSADMGSMQVLCPERSELRLLACRGFHPVSAAFWEWVRLDSASSCGLALSAGMGLAEIARHKSPRATLKPSYARRIACELNY